MVHNEGKIRHTMKTKTYAFPSILIATALLLPSCDVRYDMVTFKAVGIMPAATTPVPKIEIDTNVTAGMMGGAVKSNKPYDIRTDYLDDTFTFASAEFTAVTVTYADGTNDPGAAALKLPMRFQNRLYESSNSMAGGVVVVKKSRIIQAVLPGTISRDEPFTLLIEGNFTKDNGTVIPFKIKEKYDISWDKRTESWVEFVSGC
jgi:hypothetical protein